MVRGLSSFVRQTQNQPHGILRRKRMLHVLLSTRTYIDIWQLTR